jgi:hypothetical protein
MSISIWYVPRGVGAVNGIFQTWCAMETFAMLVEAVFLLQDEGFEYAEILDHF